MYLLAKAIARSSLNEPGLSGIFINPDITNSKEFAQEIAREANRIEKADPHIALIVEEGSPEKDQERSNLESDFKIVSSGKAIAYRKDKRLFISSRISTLSSITQSVKPILTETFPYQNGGTISISTLSEKSLNVCLDEAEIKVDQRPLLKIEKIKIIFELLRDAYQANSMQGSFEVNVSALWFNHVNSSLEILSKELIKAKADKKKDLNQFLDETLYAAFSLPSPDDGNRYTAEHTGKEIAKVCTEHWSTATGIQKNLSSFRDQLDKRHPLETVEWGKFDEIKENLNLKTIGPLLAFALVDKNNPDRTTCFKSFTEKQYFLDSFHNSDQPAWIEIKDSTGKPLKIEGATGDLVFIDGSHIQDDTGNYIESQEITIEIMSDPISEPDLSASNPKIEIKEQGFIFLPEGSFFINADGHIAFKGKIWRKVSKKKFNYKLKTTSIIFILNKEDPASKIIKGPLEKQFILLPPNGAGTLFFQENLKNKQIKFSSQGTENFDPSGKADPDETSYQQDLAGDKLFEIIIWSKQGNVSPELTKQSNPINESPNHNFIWTINNYKPTSWDQLKIGEIEVEISISETSPPSAQSPITAAIKKVELNTEEPTPEQCKSIFGEFEKFYSKILETNKSLSTIGHIIFPVDEQMGEVENLEIANSGDIHTLKSIEVSVLDELDNIPKEVSHSDEANKFREAFESLDVLEKIASENADGPFLQYPSKISWAYLNNSPKLNNYLKTYTNLVKVANKLGDEKGLLWAAYPFSVSLWKTKDTVECKSILLSPLHPLRLAWLAKVENALKESDSAHKFAGTLEAWNIPMIGPADSKAGRMIAIPTDTGPEQIFIGWSQLVRASIDGPKSLVAPELIGRKKMPSSSSSGLNKQSALAAIKDFCRVHSYMPTVTIDLAASNPSAKMEELDDALIDALLSNYIGENLSGIRVYDSINRIGHPPSYRLSDGMNDSDISITWKRYDPEKSNNIESNIKILQDSGIKIELRTNNADKNLGVIGDIPFRRFEVPAPHSNGPKSSSRPTLQSKENYSDFENALNAIEMTGEEPEAKEIQYELNSQSPIISSSEWTISGESMISPAALSLMMDKPHSNNQMLWEWNPPFLGTENEVDQIPSINRRPYFTIARVPDIFKKELINKLETLLDRVATDDANDVIKTLGARGVGLSKMLTIGGSQLRGALGFYLVLKLMENKQLTGVNRFVMPIDSCNRFLESIGNKQGKDSKRADLLIIDLSKDSILFTPIEIKFYRIENPAADLPLLRSNELSEAREQLIATNKLLESVCENWEETCKQKNTYEHLLSANALASLVEASMRLNPVDNKVDLEISLVGLSNIVNGKSSVRIGKPIIAFFQCTEPIGGINYGTEINVEPKLGPSAEFIADPRYVFQNLHDNGPSKAKWNEILKWATSDSSEKKTTNSNLGLSESDLVDFSETPTSEVPEESERPDDYTSTGKIENSGINEGGVRFEIGKLTGSIGEGGADFWPSNTELTQLNIGVIGDLGTGKTQLLKALVYQLKKVSKEKQSDQPVSILILDYKRDYQNPEFLGAVDGVAYEPNGIPLDIFGIKGEKTSTIAWGKAKSFVDVIKKIYGGIGPSQETKLAEAISSLIIDNETSPTMEQVLNSYKKKYASADSVVSILSDFVNYEIFDSDHKNLKPLSELIENKVVVISLAALGADQKAKNALVALFLNQYYDYMLKLKKWPYSSENDIELRKLSSFLLVDEATLIMQYGFAALNQILLQGREFGVGVILSSQFLSHFSAKGVDYSEPLLTWLIHKVPQAKVDDLQKIGAPAATQNDADRISTLKIHEAYLVTLGYNGRFITGTPFYKLIGEQST